MLNRNFYSCFFNHFQKLYKPVKPHSDTVTSSSFYPVFDIDIVFTTLFAKIEVVKVSKKKKNWLKHNLLKTAAQKYTNRKEQTLN